MSKIDTILNKKSFNKEDLIFLINLKDKNKIQKLYKKAYKIKRKNVGKTVYFRGIIEFSNICEKNCLYCGIRKDNKRVNRYIMDKETIIDSALWAYKNDYGSLVLQSGERTDDEFIDFVEDILLKIKEKTSGKLGITLSVGEQKKSTYKRWFEAGAHRYLLRIETSNKELYKKLHPKNHDFNKRYKCLKSLQKIGYQVGTGVMIGLPYQTREDLINDILFYKDFNIDMIGMGPYIIHKDTPLAKNMKEFKKNTQLELGLKMVALTRIFLKDVNIAATTALQALNPIGREMGLKAGANIVMPNITSIEYRDGYKLYDDKPCTDENSEKCKSCLKYRIESIGEKIGYNKWGDSPHYFKRVKGSY